MHRDPDPDAGSGHGRHYAPEPDQADASNAFAELIEQLPEGIVVAGRDGRMIWANKRAERLTGYPLTQSLGTHVKQALPLRDSEAGSWWADHDPWSALSTVSGSPEQRLLLPNGRSVLYAARYTRRPDRTIQRVVITLRDPRARERIEADSSALITTVAHELRSPLTSVRGFSRTLRSRWNDLADEQKLWMLEAIENDSLRLSRLVGELLDISRIDTGRLELRLQPLDLGAIVDEQVTRLVSAGHDPARFKVEKALARPEIWGDQDRLTQVVTNLLENAVRHGAGTVTVTIDQTGNEITLLIADEGPGIPQEHRELAFARFWQGRTHGGSGLGLYVVRGLVQAHGGRVEILDEVKGAAIRVALPAGLPDSLR